MSQFINTRLKIQSKRYTVSRAVIWAEEKWINFSLNFWKNYSQK